VHDKTRASSRLAITIAHSASPALPASPASTPWYVRVRIRCTHGLDVEVLLRRIQGWVIERCKHGLSNGEVEAKARRSRRLVLILGFGVGIGCNGNLRRGIVES
jgi:hypothetical protein